MTKAWHYAWQGKSEGPVDEAMMGDLIRAGRVRADTLIWAEGMGDWERADAHFPFAPARPAAPAYVPPPPAGPPPLGRESAYGPYEGAPPRDFIEAIKVCFRKYATFKGRASRSEFWWFQLFIIGGSLLTGLLENGMGRDGAVLNGLFSLATFLPALSVQVRRLHDTDRSGWWIGGFYLAIIPGVVVLGVLAAMVEGGGGNDMALGAIAIAMGVAVLVYSILMLVFLASRSTPGPNRFG
ncbi:uncharacterized membrane protein YhaH [Rhodobacter sp. JA431]|uniref:DUF805 domain-containing protein n=1 Tax=Rhodobacter sp. JA431 TaxID=570013 RepID=UPI000BD82FE7|nr:DUF805 domain-containing protein [Rhodobacter sp. JA431]SOB92127.1 uncharacterized membrane protein YhaH [Rhodobacter sp. JA431]